MASPAVVTDMPVLVLLMLAWVTVPVFWAHLLTGLALIVMIGIYLLTRRHLPLRVGRPLRRLAYASFLLAATAMAATGFMRWTGIPPQYAWHGGTSYLAARIRVRTRRERGARNEH
jgi:hypothetical protein